MHIFLDENIPKQIAHALAILEKKYKVSSIPDYFGSGIADEDWIPQLKDLKGVIITQDINIKRTKHQWSLFQNNELIAFFLHPPSKSGFSYWEFVRIIVKHWEEIIKKAERAERPFSFKITSKGTIEDF